MNIKLKKSEIKALRQLCTRDDSIAQLSAKLEAKPSFTSRVLDGLKKKGLVEFSKTGAMKIVRLSSASHAQYFKLLSDSRPQASIEEWLSGYAMDILVAALAGTEVTAKGEIGVVDVAG